MREITEVRPWDEEAKLRGVLVTGPEIKDYYRRRLEVLEKECERVRRVLEGLEEEYPGEG